MKYADGQEMRLGDRVRLGTDDGGVVVAMIATGEYSREYTEAQWGYLKKGALVEFPSYGPIHCEAPDEGLELIARDRPQRSDRSR